MIEHFIEPRWPAPANVLALCTTRQGGVSRAPFASLNLADHVGDDLAAVRANRDLLLAALPAGSAVQWLSQVHGVRVIEAAREGGPCPQADAAWSRQRGQACAVMTADCLPVLFCSAAGDIVAAAHAGWRGLLHGVLEATVGAMATTPGEILAWLGPAIGPRAFEVGAEVREEFLAVAPDPAAAATCFTPAAHKPHHYYADLYRLATLRLERMGVSRIYTHNACTFADNKSFYSYRRDGQTGRMASLILLLPVQFLT